MSKREYTHVRLLYPEIKASIHKGRHVGQPAFSELFALLSLAGASPPASKRTKIPRKSKAVRCEAVLREQKCPQTMKSPQRILCVFSRALRKYEGISAPPNRVCPCQSTQEDPYFLFQLPESVQSSSSADSTSDEPHTPRGTALSVCPCCGARVELQNINSGSERPAAESDDGAP